MIADRLAHARRYAGLGPSFARAFEFLERPGLDAVADGRYDLDGARLFALVQRYVSKPVAEGKWEAHRRYADLQFIVTGQERIGYGPAERFAGHGYDEEKDFEVLSGSGDHLRLEAGGFVILWPGEAHMPQIAVEDPAPVTKVVLKIRMQ